MDDAEPIRHISPLTMLDLLMKLHDDEPASDAEPDTKSIICPACNHLAEAAKLSTGPDGPTILGLSCGDIFMSTLRDTGYLRIRISPDIADIRTGE